MYWSVERTYRNNCPKAIEIKAYEAFFSLFFGLGITTLGPLFFGLLTPKVPIEILPFLVFISPLPITLHFSLMKDRY